MSQHWPAARVELRPIDILVPYARNARTHSEDQVAQIAASVREWGWTVPVLIDEDGGLIAGHGRVLAARKLGITQVPTMVATGWTEAQTRSPTHPAGSRRTRCSALPSRRNISPRPSHRPRRSRGN